MCTDTKSPDVELIEPGKVRVKCRKCGELITLVFGSMSRETAEEVLAGLDRVPRECPGYHVELCGWRYYWRFDEALDAAYGPVPTTIAELAADVACCGR